MDEAVVRAMNAWAADPATAGVGRALSSVWVPLVVWSAVGLYLLARRRYAAMLAVVLAVAAADLGNSSCLKPLVGRPRPCRALAGLVLPERCGAGHSFASSHTAVATAFVVSASPVVPWGWALFGPLAALVAGSRVVLGQHYPSDLLGGVAVGSVAGLAGQGLRRRLERRGSGRARGPSAGAGG